MFAELFSDDFRREFCAHRRRILLKVSKSATHMFGKALVDVAGHLTDLHESALHLPERFADLLSGLHLKREVQFTTFPSVGKNSTGAMSGIGPTGLCAEHRKAEVAGASATVLNWPSGIALRTSAFQDHHKGSNEAKGQEKSKGSASRCHEVQR
jgi:hypothetical protein